MSEEWRERAACKGMDQSIFFPERGGDFWTAASICAACPVRVECGDYATEHPELMGIWGGLSDRKRTRDRRELNRTPNRSWAKNSTEIRDADHDDALEGLVLMLQKLASA